VSVTGRGQTSARISFLVLISLVAILLSAMALIRPLLPTAQANHVTPTAVSGNASCGQLGDYDFEFKIDEAPETGTYTDPNSDFEVEIVLNDDGSIDFESNLPVDAVFIKGGNEGGNLYVYDPPVTSDTGLDTPNSQGISHISFCFHEEPEVTPTPTPTPTPEVTPTPTPTPEVTPTPTPTPEVTPTPTPTPEGSELPGTPTPTPAPTETPRESELGGNPTPTAAPLPNTALTDDASGSTAATLLGLLAMISMGSLVYGRLAERWIRNR